MSKKKLKDIEVVTSAVLDTLSEKDKEKFLKNIETKIDQKRKTKLEQEYKTMINFNNENKGFENYILFVNKIFEPQNIEKRDQFLQMLNERYDKFENYDIKFNQRFVVDDKNNPLINEIFSIRNVDLLMESDSELYKQFLEDKNKVLYDDLLNIDPSLAFEYLVHSEKRMSKKSKQDFNERISKALSNEENDLITQNLESKGVNTVKNFLNLTSKEQLNTNALDGLFIRKKVTPLGTLPVKKIIQSTNDAIEDFKLKKIKIKNKNKINFSIPKNVSELTNRLKKWSKNILFVLVASSSFITINASTKMDVLSQMNVQKEASQLLEKEVNLVKNENYTVKKGDSLYSIARELLNAEGDNYTINDVGNKVQEIVKDNPSLSNGLDSIIKPKQKIKIRT